MIISIVRLVAAVVKLEPGPDLTWTLVNVIIWSFIEASLAVTAGSLPSLGPLFRHQHRWFWQRTTLKRKDGGSNGLVPTPASARSHLETIGSKTIGNDSFARLYDDEGEDSSIPLGDIHTGRAVEAKSGNSAGRHFHDV